MKVKDMIYDNTGQPGKMYIIYDSGMITSCKSDTTGEFDVGYCEKILTNNIKQICHDYALFDDGSIYEIYCSDYDIKPPKFIMNNIKKIDGVGSLIYALTNDNNIFELTNQNKKKASDCKYMSNYFYIGNDNIVYRIRDGSKCVDNNGDPIKNIREARVAYGYSLGLLLDNDNNIYYSAENYFMAGTGPKYLANKLLVDNDKKIFNKSNLKAKKIFSNGCCIIAILLDGNVGKITINEDTKELDCETILLLTPGSKPVERVDCFILSYESYYARGTNYEWVYNYKEDYAIINSDNNISGMSTNVKKVAKMFKTVKHDNGYVEQTPETFKLLNDNTDDASWSLNTTNVRLSTILDLTTMINKYSAQKTVISTSANHTIYLKDDETIMTCGKNDCGQLGLNGTKYRSVLTKVPDISNVKQVSAGESHSMILFNDGTIATCGSNKFGQLGLGNNENKNIFTKVPGIKDVEQISCGGNTSTIRLINGDIYACGENNDGQLALGDNINKNKFTKINFK